MDLTEALYTTRPPVWEMVSIDHRDDRVEWPQDEPMWTVG